MPTSNHIAVNADLRALLDSQYLARIHEYCALAVRSHLSEADANRLGELLTMAETDGHLDFWIHEADHFLDHALGLSSETRVYAFINENLKARLRELLTEDASNDESCELIQEIQESLNSGTRQIQQQLKSHGFDPGPLDGVPGPRTQAALSQFQQAHALTTSGLIDPATQSALGL
ncbi:hypothetical protein XM38_026510 [Halomicronema hongdechloris C2206]|uniref:Peptidoglycan binding-like domain-containing protein n=1 Tax=Halomicronema hongdechloris C2206 TaxID=1641165 RepID=A0A1Z3HNG7_9CYAN|nr:peptidoglycan-binding domain-containing protein [Halomicronema hongdechloris]ASC71697.1 hypothetical protein XM38_026510 [Halomicronema hongdechloris C2206]